MVRKQNLGALAALLVVAAMTGGCGKQASSLDEAYSFNRDYTVLTERADERLLADAFASDLCVITEEPLGADEVTSQSAAVFDVQNGEVIVSKNALERMNPASTTKIMTALLAVKYGDLSDEVTVTEEAVITEAGATLAKVHPGDVLTMEQLLYGLMLPSGNDAGVAIAVHMAGSIEAFSDMMNEEARSLGATGTHFTNPHGLTEPDHYTTAYDLYLMFNEALKYQEFRTVTGTTSYTAAYRNGSGEPVTQTWKGGNWYMIGERQAPEGLTVFGGKTGTTSAAGYCLVMASRDREEQEYISVVLKADSRPGLYDNMSNIIRKIVN